MRLVTYWNNPVGGGEKKKEIKYSLTPLFFFKYNGLGIEARKKKKKTGLFEEPQLLHFTHARKPAVSYCFTWIQEQANRAFENHSLF